MIFRFLILYGVIDSLIERVRISSSLSPDGTQLLRDYASENSLVFISKKEWKSRPAKTSNLLKLSLPVSYVIIHDMLVPPACYDRIECKYAMRTLQTIHMDQKGWLEIGYNFAIGGDGAVYEGRGWNSVGSHALNFNTESIGICLIGNWNDELPPKNTLTTLNLLLEQGVRDGYISEDYELISHRQTRRTRCPGNALHNYIKTLPHYHPDTLY